MTGVGDTPSLSPRQWSILEAVHSAAAAGRPAGSLALAKHSGLPWSAPTIRNEMRAMRDRGLLEWVHAFGGSRPTERGSRLLLGRWCQDAKADPAAGRQWVLGQVDRFLEEVAARLTAELDLPAFFILPDIAGAQVRRFSIHRLGPRDGLFCLELANGWVESRRAALPSGLDAEAVGRDVDKAAAGRALTPALLDRVAALAKRPLGSSVLSFLAGLVGGRRLGLRGLTSGWRQELGAGVEGRLAGLAGRLGGRPTALLPAETGLEGVVLLGHGVRLREQRAVVGAAGPLAVDWQRAIATLKGAVRAAGARS